MMTKTERQALFEQIKQQPVDPRLLEVELPQGFEKMTVGELSQWINARLQNEDR